ncbi:class I adenylate-forming enzyme family protein [Maricaulis parjimensis]|uniref:class I adenylate-forming enzyme family protein n=1 Tax=Maricaulis parjimensis TaxID=144023 RepID=UPI0019393EB9|nr:AMP-binding protein [Maricaulis parjimensis]
MDIITDITARRAELTPDKVAFRDVLTGDKTTYAQLDLRGARTAGYLAGRGVRPGDRVGVFCRNRVEFFELLFGCAKLGAILVPFNWRMTARELRDLVDDCAPTLCLAGGEEFALASQALSDTGIELVDLEQDFPAGRDAAQPHAGRQAWPGDETWYLIYTSGTTGRPKGVIQTYRMALVNYVNIAQATGLTGADSTLNFLPLFHTAGINLHTLPVLIAGGQVHIMPGFDAGRMLDLINQDQIDILLGVPSVFRELIEHPDFAAAELTRVRHWASGGAPLPNAIVETFAERGAILCNGFGMTETGPTAFLADPAHALSHIGSVGQTQILSQARIAAPDGTILPTGEIGEVQFFGPGLTPGYWQRPTETAELFTDDGWLRSGDLGRIDADGHGYVVGRIKEMYISGGENVYPAEIEDVLAQHPALADIAIAGVDDHKWGEVGCAYYVSHDGQEIPTDQLERWCRDRLAAYKVPRHFIRCDSLPRTAAGKIQKHLLPVPQIRTESGYVPTPD